MATPELYQHRDKADRIKSGYTEQVAKIQADKDLTEEGRHRQLAERWADARTKLDALAQAETEELAKRRESLERKVFGAGDSRPGWRSAMDAGAAAISARDASDRAAQLSTPAAALQALVRAEGDCDEVLARAIARHSMQSSYNVPTRLAGEWEAVFSQYLDARPLLMGSVEELAEIERMTQRQVLSPFSLPHPYGVAPQVINAAQGEARAKAAV